MSENFIRAALDFEIVQGLLTFATYITLMFPDLSYILHYFFGTMPDNGFSIVKTFGLLLAMAILTAAWILNKELIRKEEEGLMQPVKTKVTVGAPASPMELLVNAVFGFILGFKVPYAIAHWDAMKADAAGVILSGQGTWLWGIVGALVFAGYKYWEKYRERLPKPEVKEINVYPHDRIGDITILAAVTGVIGAKIFAILEDPSSFLTDPAGTFFSGSGMAIYGGLILPFLFFPWYLKRYKIPFLHFLDAIAPALIVAYGVGRLGCHFSGDGDWGIVNAAAQPSWWFLPDWLWAFDYPNNVLNEGVAIDGCTWKYCNRLAEGVYPTPVYETIMALLIGAFLWAIRKKVRIAGMLFFIYLIFNGVERFFIESIRVNVRYNFLGIQPTQAEIIAVITFVIGVIGCLVLWQRKRKSV